MTVLSFILAAVTLAGAVAAMTLRRLVHCALALTVAFAGLAALYLSLNAQFAGLAQLLIYVGAIAILIVFAILLTPSSNDSDDPSRPWISLNGITGVALAIAVFAILAWGISRSKVGNFAVMSASPQASMQQIGQTLIARYVLPLEVIGIMLTAALIGAVIIALQERQAAR
jgi:NADH-quinone oxidoreductase subunit J